MAVRARVKWAISLDVDSAAAAFCNRKYARDVKQCRKKMESESETAEGKNSWETVKEIIAHEEIGDVDIREIHWSFQS